MVSCCPGIDGDAALASPDTRRLVFLSVRLIMESGSSLALQNSLQTVAKCSCRPLVLSPPPPPLALTAEVVNSVTLHASGYFGGPARINPSQSTRLKENIGLQDNLSPEGRGATGGGGGGGNWQIIASGERREFASS